LAGGLDRVARQGGLSREDALAPFVIFDLLASGALVPLLPDYQTPELEIVARSILIAGT